MPRPQVTVLTGVVIGGWADAYRRARALARKVVKPGAPLPAVSPYPGHYALTRSVVEGLREIGVDFTYNPARFRDVGPIVYAPADEALRQAIAMKRAGRITRLVAGPTNALLPDEQDGVLLSPEIDAVIVASPWQTELYAGYPALVAKSRACPAGVDARTWAPSGAPRRRHAVLSWKSGEAVFCEAVERVLRDAGYEVTRFKSAHGEHAIFSPHDLRAAFDTASVGVFLSSFETQGLALAEAWAMDVPTLVWDPQGDAVWRGRHFISRSSAPYLTRQTGLAWKSLDELRDAVAIVGREPASFQPRDWVLAHMTDAICARQLWAILTDPAAAGAVPAGSA